MKSRIFLSLILTILLSACSTEKLELAIDKVQGQANELRKNQADHISRIATLEEQVRMLNGKLEELQYAQDKRLGSDLTSLRQDLSDMKKKLPPPAIVPVAALEADELSATRMPASIGQQYAEALANIRSGEFSLAKSLLEELRALTEGTEQEAFMLFWGGVVLEGLTDDKGALESYLIMTSKYPKHTRVALAMLRQASVLIRLKDSKAAQITLKKLINDFPKSDEAMRARERLRDVK